MYREKDYALSPCMESSSGSLGARLLQRKIGFMSVTNHQAKYFAHKITRKGGEGVERLGQSLLNASVDLNPHQVEAALFALQSPISKGVILADEVGLGKTIEAGLVMCQMWAERKRKIIVICPASLRKQWQVEMEDKFNLPCIVVDAKSAKELQKEGFANPYEKPCILISSYAYAARNAELLRQIQWDCCVIDEAHKLRNSYRESSRTGQAIRFALKDRRKLLLTATPLQNSLVELFGLATLIDDGAFGGDVGSFRNRFLNNGGDMEGLRERLKEFCWRTLRKDVTEFVKYTERIPMTEKFQSSDREHALYEDISAYLQDKTTYAFPPSQRHMLTLVVRKVLASSSWAMVGTLESIKSRLERMHRGEKDEEESLIDEIFADDPDLVSEINEDAEEASQETAELGLPGDEQDFEGIEGENEIDPERLAREIELIDDFIRRAKSIGTDTKTQRLLFALRAGWAKLAEIGAPQKAVIFTESRRSMNFLREYLEANGYYGEVVCFSGGGKKDERSEEIYKAYKQAHPEDTTSKPIMMRHALIDHFKNKAKILIATEAGAEGINLQFCSMLVNYDLPWNPQRVEQRIGRCHRYGQKFNVVVVNFCNTRNAADVRVFELLREKFKLFEGLFGASNDILGVVGEDGKSFETRIYEILQRCKTEEEINAEFDRLQQEFQEEIQRQRESTQKAVIENLDEDVRQRLKIDPSVAKDYLTNGERQFMDLTRNVLGGRAMFADSGFSFCLEEPPKESIPKGRYSIKRDETAIGTFAYRPNSELGEWALSAAKNLEISYCEVSFDISHHEGRISAVEALQGKSGYLRLDRVLLKSLDEEERLLFTAFTEDGKSLDADIAERFFNLATEQSSAKAPSETMLERMAENADQYVKATVSEIAQANNKLFLEATEKLDRWSEDQIAAATHKVDILRSRQREVQRSIRAARTIDEQLPLQREYDKIRREIRRARADVSSVEDETDEKREKLLDALERRIVPTTERECLFTIKWKII